jgi:hypothetical protein
VKVVGWEAATFGEALASSVITIALHSLSWEIRSFCCRRWEVWSERSLYCDGLGETRGFLYDQKKGRKVKLNLLLLHRIIMTPDYLSNTACDEMIIYRSQETCPPQKLCIFDTREAKVRVLERTVL